MAIYSHISAWHSNCLLIVNVTCIPKMRRWTSAVTNGCRQFTQCDSGQDLIEYALLAGFISLVAVAAITSVGTNVNVVYGGLEEQVSAIPGGSGANESGTPAVSEDP